MTNSSLTALIWISLIVTEIEANAQVNRHHVLVVPGIEGSMSSELFCKSSTDVADVENWINDTPNSFRWPWDKLTKITFSMPSEWTIDPVQSTYTPLINYLQDNGEVPEPVPYDWRLSIPEIARQFLKPHIDAAIARNARVDIVAHSMGGLVVRYHIQTFGGEGIRNVFFLGTPHRGSVIIYPLWEGGDPGSARSVERAKGEILLENMKQGCGCDSDPDYRFLRSGCEPQVHAFASVQSLLPVFPYLRGKKLSRLAGYLYEDPASMCLQNNFLEALNSTADNLFDWPIHYHVFAGTTEQTPMAIVPKNSLPKDCAREPWPDGESGSIKKSKSGDGQVLYTESACPKNFIPAFANIPCITQDTIFPGKKPAKHIVHGDLPTIYKEEIATEIKKPFCGDSYLEGTEECDDGNKIDGDCCSSSCAFEPAGEQICGKGACLNRSPLCAGGKPVLCEPLPPSESHEQSCNDGIDNDCDLRTDCADDDCAYAQACVQASPPGYFTITHTVLPEEDPALGTVNPQNCHANNPLCVRPHFIRDMAIAQSSSTVTNLIVNGHNGFNEPVTITTEAVDHDDDTDSFDCPDTAETPCADGIPDGTPFPSVADSGFFFYFHGDYAKTVSRPLLPGAYAQFNALVTGGRPGRYIIFLKGTTPSGKSYINQILLVYGQNVSGYREQ